MRPISAAAGVTGYPELGFGEYRLNTCLGYRSDTHTNLDMSLAQHVTQADGFESDVPRTDNQLSIATDQEASPVVNPNKPEWQRMSFSLAYSDPEKNHTAAYKVSITKRIGTLSLALLSNIAPV